MGAQRWAAGLVAFALVCAGPALAQQPPSPSELKAYPPLHSAAAHDDAHAIEKLAQGGAAIDTSDAFGRTPLIVAAHFRCHAAARLLLRLGADARAQERQHYDILTIAAVNDDLRMLRIALKHGADARAITAPHRGTALIAAAQRGHAEVVRELIRAGAVLDYVNATGLTATLHAVALGDGGLRHTETLALLLEAGADPAVTDRDGWTARDHARRRGYAAMAEMLDEAERRPLIRP